MGEEQKPQRMKVAYTRQVNVEGLVKFDDGFIWLSLDDGATWAMINSKNVDHCIPTNY